MTTVRLIDEKRAVEARIYSMCVRHRVRGATPDTAHTSTHVRDRLPTELAGFMLQTCRRDGRAGLYVRPLWVRRGVRLTGGGWLGRWPVLADRSRCVCALRCARGGCHAPCLWYPLATRLPYAGLCASEASTRADSLCTFCPCVAVGTCLPGIV
eukprot:5383745-Prymnesium_polylepis.1